jgi:glucose/arabinose dehydrogenase
MKYCLIKILLLLLLLSCGQDNGDTDTTEAPQEQEERVDYLFDRDDVIWGFDFLPDERILFTERSGKMFLFDPSDESVSEVSGVPNVSADGEGGLLDLKLHPNFRNNNQIYFCYTANGKTQALGRGVLQDSHLSQVEELFKTEDENNSNIHFGCRIAFENENRLFLSIGDQAESDKAQDLNSHFGKIIRLNDDGSVPTDNPFVGDNNALPEIWSLGHRNPQGLTIRPGTQELYSSEHGPTGGDELNIISKGKNYGWPLVTSGSPSGELGESAPGYVDPITTWSPAIAPSGIAFYRGDLYIATLRGRHIRKLTLNGSTVESEEVLLEGEDQRFRNLVVGPDDFLYFSTDDGKIGRVRNL